MTLQQQQAMTEPEQPASKPVPTVRINVVRHRTGDVVFGDNGYGEVIGISTYVSGKYQRYYELSKTHAVEFYMDLLADGGVELPVSQAGW